jgi:hypothetical protein
MGFIRSIDLGFCVVNNFLPLRFATFGSFECARYINKKTALT